MAVIVISSARAARSWRSSSGCRLVDYFRRNHPGDKIRVTATGHSLGGALAMLTAWDAAGNGKLSAGGEVSVSAVTFGAPRVGNQAFCDELVGRRGVAVERVVVNHDVVPSVPPTFIGYADAGEVRLLDAGREFAAGPFLSFVALWHFHRLKRYLGLMDPTYHETPVPAPEQDRDDTPLSEVELDSMISSSA